MELKKQFELTNREGLHARPAMKLVEVASRFTSDILIRHEGKEVNAKSIMMVLTLGVSQGAVLEIVVSGEDAEDAMSALEKLITGKFDEQ
jgi:phosphocarrier protein